jgi:hypothetical protein
VLLAFIDSVPRDSELSRVESQAFTFYSSLKESQFVAMFKSFGHKAFHLINHFHRRHLKQILNGDASNRKHSMTARISNRSQSQFLAIGLTDEPWPSEK